MVVVKSNTQKRSIAWVLEQFETLSFCDHTKMTAKYESAMKIITNMVWAVSCMELRVRQ